MGKNKSERKQIAEELQWLYANFPKFDLISDMKNLSLRDNQLGINVGHFKESNYKDLYTKTFEDELYTICLSDYSLICMNYQFDYKGNTTAHNLMYIPSPLNEDEHISFQESISKYIRIDFDQSGYTETVHTLVHLHTSIYKSKMRIPIQHIITPKDFLYIIFKYLYHSNEPLVDNLLTHKNRNNLLDDIDKGKMRILLGSSS